jgi:hypothetical protein
MSIWPTSTRPSATTPSVRPPRRRSRRRILAGTVTVISIFALLTAGPARAATPTLTLTPTVTAGTGTVSFNATVAGSAAGDTAYVCFGDEAPALCDGTHASAGTAVDMTAATGPSGATFPHTYAAEGTFNAVLYAVQPGAPATVTASSPSTVTVTIDGTAQLRATTSGLTATFDGTKSTAAVGDTWWACFGDNLACNAGAPDLKGTVATGSAPLQQVAHTYAAPGKDYPASLTVIGTATTSTAAAAVTVNFPEPTAVLSADSTSGSGSLPVIFDGSKSVVGAGDSWQFCFGDVSTCTAATPDATGRITAAGPTVALSTTAHNYPPGNYTATLWVANATTTTSATVKITVTNPIAGPGSTCSLSGTTRTCDLFAKGNGAVTAGTGPDKKTIPFWGFTTSDAAAPVLGGPELVATEGEKLAFTVHNELDVKAGPVSITVSGLIGAPDPTGVAPGATGASNPLSGPLTLTRPGTYIYEAGMTAGGARQVAMGLSGVLIVRPSVPTASNSARCAYDPAVNNDCVTNKDPNNYFDREKLVVVNELDAGFSADPFKSDTGNYHPTNYFIDGVAYDASKAALDPTDLAFDPALNNVRLDAARGDTVLLRYADLGLREHSINLMDLKQTETARDANLLPGTHVHNTEFLNAGETADTFVTIPADATKGIQYPLFDAGFHLNNGVAGGLGGMYSYLDVINGLTANDLGPMGTAASATPTFSNAAPNVDNGQIPTLRVTGSFTAKPPSTATVDKVQWALDGVPAPGGLWQQSTASADPAGSTTASFDFTIPVNLMDQLLGAEPDRIFGDHTVWLQAIDSKGNAGSAIGASFALARRDAVISTLSIDPKVTNGTTRSSQGPVASTKINLLSNGQAVTTSPAVLNVKSTAGFPATCSAPNACDITIGMTIASGPAQGDTEYGLFRYTGLTPTTFTGLTADASVTTGNHTLSTGSTVALDVVPAGYIAVGATATASLPGWVIGASQACLVYSGTELAPAAADQAKCDAPGAAVTNLTPPNQAPVDSLAGVNGFIATPKLPTGVTDGGKFWVMVRAQEGPYNIDCTTVDACRWSPWLYYQSDGSADSSTYQQLTVVKSGPTTGAVTVSPNPNNGFTAAAGNLGLFDSFNVQATATSDWANIALAETFLATTSRAPDATAPADPFQCTSLAPDTPAGCVVFGQGAEMTPAGGLWNHTITKSVTAFLPLSELQGMPDGLVRVWVHAKDIAGNWGGFTSVDLTLDKTAPVVDSLVNSTPAPPSTTIFNLVQPLPPALGRLTVASTVGFPAIGGSVTIATPSVRTYTYTGTSTTQLLGVSGPRSTTLRGAAVKLVVTPVIVVKAHDALSNNSSSGLVGAEWFTGTDPGPGNATKVTVATGSANTFPGPANSAAVQSYTVTGLPRGTVNVRVVDAAGNWSVTVAVQL